MTAALLVLAGSSAEFPRVAERLEIGFQSVGLPVQRVDLRTGREAVEAADKFASGSVGHLIICGHGGASWLLNSRRGLVVERTNRGPDQRDVGAFAEAWAPVLVPHPQISLAACLCLRSPDWWLKRYVSKVIPSAWSVESYLRGGQASFGARLRDRLVWEGLLPVIRGHLSEGHLTGNPLVAELPFMAGEPYVPLFELVTEKTKAAKITPADRNRWARKPEHGGQFSGTPAERWLLFDDSVVEDLRAVWNSPA